MLRKPTEKLMALKASDWMEFSANDKPRCPHCGEDFDITDNEAWHLYDENYTHDVTCMDCDMDFRVNASAKWYFSTDEQED